MINSLQENIFLWEFLKLFTWHYMQLDCIVLTSIVHEYVIHHITKYMSNKQNMVYNANRFAQRARLATHHWGLENPLLGKYFSSHDCLVKKLLSKTVVWEIVHLSAELNITRKLKVQLQLCSLDPHRPTSKLGWVWGISICRGSRIKGCLSNPSTQRIGWRSH